MHISAGFAVRAFVFVPQSCYRFEVHAEISGGGSRKSHKDGCTKLGCRDTLHAGAREGEENIDWSNPNKPNTRAGNDLGVGHGA